MLLQDICQGHKHRCRFLMVAREALPARANMTDITDSQSGKDRFAACLKGGPGLKLGVSLFVCGNEVTCHVKIDVSSIQDIWLPFHGPACLKKPRIYILAF